MASKFITIFALLATLLASSNAYRIIDIQNDFTDLSDSIDAKNEDLYFVSEEKDEQFEQKMAQADDLLKKLEERLKKLEDGEENLQQQLKKSQESNKRNRKEKKQIGRSKFADYEEVEHEKPAFGIWDVAVNISKMLLNKLMSFFGLSFIKF
ncbi:hypothetical protein ACKWTF_016319 [Chironomus riparius]